MPKKLAKKFVKQTFELPGEVTREAVKQVGVIPAREKEPELADEELEEKRKKDEAMKRKRLTEIEAEIKQVVEKKEAVKAQTRQEEELEKKEKKKKEKEPLIQPKSKKSRRFTLGLKRKLERVLPEWVGRRISG